MIYCLLLVLCHTATAVVTAEDTDLFLHSCRTAAAALCGCLICFSLV